MEHPNFALFLLLMFASTMNAHLFPHEICATAGNFTANGTYQTTLTALLSSISTTNSLSLTYGFFNASAAVSGTSQTLYVVGSCRGDLTAESCRTCLEAATSDIRRLCPLRKAAVLYCENCTVRYSSTSIFGTVATDPDYQVVNVNNVTSPDTYNSALKTLLDELRGEAAGGSFLRKYATGDASTGFDSIYAMTQCTPDLTKQECSDCLVTVIGRLTWCCAGKMGVLIVAPSCQFRYETNNRFFGPISEPLLPLPASSSPKTDALPPPRGKSNKSTGIILVVAIVVGEGLVFLFFACCFCPKKATRTYADVQGDRNGINEITKEDVVTDAESPQYDLATIRAATDNFSHQNKLGEGGFGEVFKGKLPNGQLIAVKRLSQSSEQGTVEFKNEVILLAKLQHRNLVQLLGFSLEGEQKLLVYEFVPNKSLDFFLFDPQKSRQLNWSTRYQIACGVARGVLYLHRDSRLRIIHRDLKPSNILLDSEMNPKISDFGMARIFKDGQTQANTKKVIGTLGYISPEYAMNGDFSEKSDVYSVGVLFLELISGEKNISFSQANGGEGLASYAWKKWKAGRPLEVLDPAIGETYSGNEVVRCLKIGLACVQQDPNYRPTMAVVVNALDSHLSPLELPQQLAFFPSTSSTERPMEELGSDQSTFRSAHSTLIK